MTTRGSQTNNMAYNFCGPLPPLVVLLALFLYFYLDARVPEPLPEKLKVKVMDAMMKTYGHTVCLSTLRYLHSNHVLYMYFMELIVLDDNSSI